MRDNWIKLNRDLINNELWLSHPFTRGQAWVDMLMIASHIDSSIAIRGIKILIKRGQIGWSVARLAHRWKWSRAKVDRFFEYLENEQQIGQQKNNVSSVVTILNYEKYQANEHQNEQQNKYQEKTNSKRTPKSSKNEQQNNDINSDEHTTNNTNTQTDEHQNEQQNQEKRSTIKNKEEYNILYIDEELKKIYPPSLLEEFLLYWNEPDSKGTPRWKKEKTWNTTMRLKRWKLNQNKWQYEKNQRFIKVDEMPKGEPRKSNGLVPIGNIIKGK